MLVKPITSRNVEDCIDDLALLLFEQKPQTFDEYKEILHDYLILHSSRRSSPYVLETSTLEPSSVKLGLSSEECAKAIESFSKAWEECVKKGLTFDAS